MTFHFESDIRTDDIIVRLIGPKGPISSDAWSIAAPSALLAGVDLALELDGAGIASLEADHLRMPHATAAGLASSQARSFSLGTNADVVAEIRMRGTPGKSGYGADLVWKRPSGAGVIINERRGAFLKIGGAWQRLPKLLYEIAEAVDRLGRATVDLGSQLAAQAALQDLLPEAIKIGEVDAKGIIGRMTIAVADCFSLDLKGTGEETKLIPVLHRAAIRTDEPLLPPDRQSAFGEDVFHRFGDARTSYALGSNSFVVLSEPLVKALHVVRRFQNRSVAARKAFFANPRIYLRSTLGDELGEAQLEDLVRETKAYSDRVIGLGLWVPRIVPWIVLPPTDWLGEPGAKGAPEPQGGLTVGDKSIPLTAKEADTLRRRIEAAIAAGSPIVPHVQGGGQVIDLPATPAMSAALSAVIDGLHQHCPEPAPQDQTDPPVHEGDTVSSGPTVLLIRANEGAVEFEGLMSPRAGAKGSGPASLKTKLKPHQREGLDWLQNAWSYGNPGVLLADDMGLGKTLQGLTFLAWLRENMQANRLPRRPLLIVAPTGLLANWQAEHDRHLTAPGLGRCLEAFGNGLKALKREDDAGRPGLDISMIAKAEWVLTTYETLRDYVADFGAVHFAVLMFDEVQKIKNPGVRLTDAAKAIRADFVIAMTGTPVENRLADLWCITDTVHPAFFGDLKTFSHTYEKEGDQNRTRSLRTVLDQPLGSRPAIMLRRLKRDRLPDLPPEHEMIGRRIMPARQFAAYSAAVAEAIAANEPGAMLRALQAFRRISLHPEILAEENDDAFIAGSARLQVAFDVLDGVFKADERALIFLEERDMQGRLAGLIQRRYGMQQPPMLINGAVAGAIRQQRVDQFQDGPAGFDTMILSPKAGGVGLTLTRANHVIHLSRWWNPAVEDQCTGRASRIGQTRPVYIHLPLAILPDARRSFDENLHALLERKRLLSKDALLPPEATDHEKEDLFRRSIE